MNKLFKIQALNIPLESFKTNQETKLKNNLSEKPKCLAFLITNYLFCSFTMHLFYSFQQILHHTKKENPRSNSPRPTSDMGVGIARRTTHQIP
jgi:hypothetical protein